MSKMSVYEIVTKTILEKIENGIIPWRCPWNRRDLLPKNLITNKHYNGLNIFLLAMQGYESQFWLTRKQLKNVGGKIKEGESGSIVTFWKVFKKENKTGEEKEFRVLRYYRVFNIAQCKNIDHKRVIEEQEKIKSLQENIEFNPIEKAENIVSSYKNAPIIEHQGQRACYNKIFDKVSMPLKNSFHSEEEYYSTLFHELGHSTGHENRLKRESLLDSAAFGDPIYSQEELIAEFCASFLCAEAGISNQTIENSAAYIQGWIKQLKRNGKAVFEGSSQGRKAAEYILGQEALCN